MPAPYRVGEIVWAKIKGTVNSPRFSESVDRLIDGFVKFASSKLSGHVSVGYSTCTT